MGPSSIITYDTSETMAPTVSSESTYPSTRPTGESSSSTIGSTDNPFSTTNTYETEGPRIGITSDAPINPTGPTTMISSTSISFGTTEPTITSDATMTSVGSSRSPSTTAATTEFTTTGGPSCPPEKGYCMDESISDRNSGVYQINGQNANTREVQEQCLELCRAHSGATGCEVIWDIGHRGCFAHTKKITRGSGSDHHFCWVFSKCEEGTPTTPEKTTKLSTLGTPTTPEITTKLISISSTQGTGDTECPDGYSFQDGDKVGNHNEIKKRNVRNIVECAILCEETPGCRAFEWSPSRNNCIILRAKNADGPPFDDYRFCSKIVDTVCGNCRDCLWEDTCYEYGRPLPSPTQLGIPFTGPLHAKACEYRSGWDCSGPSTTQEATTSPVSISSTPKTVVPETCESCDGCIFQNKCYAIGTQGKFSSIEDCRNHGGKSCTGPYCVKINTGLKSKLNHEEHGYLSVSISTDQNGTWHNVSKWFECNEIVLEQCFEKFYGLQVQNTDEDSWAGTITVTVNGTEAPLTCFGCGGKPFDKEIVVDGNDDDASQANTTCLNGYACKLQLTKNEVCPPDHPILQRFTEDDQGDKCYSDDHRGHFVDYVCSPRECDFYAGPPYCIISNSDKSPCRTSE